MRAVCTAVCCVLHVMCCVLCTQLCAVCTAVCCVLCAVLRAELFCVNVHSSVVCQHGKVLVDTCEQLALPVVFVASRAL